MAGATINCRNRMTVDGSDRGNTVAGIASIADHERTGVVGISAGKTVRGMTERALDDGIGVGRCRRLADRQIAVVTGGASSGDPVMVKAAVGIQIEKAGGIVAIVTFAIGGQMKLGLAHCQYPIVALAAITEYFLMVDKGGDVESQRGVASFAQAAGANVILRFGWNRAKVVVVAIDATRR